MLGTQLGRKNVGRNAVHFFKHAPFTHNSFVNVFGFLLKIIAFA